MARLCGMPGKVGVDGKDVGPLVHAGNLEAVQNYCLCDVVQTALVFLRVQLLRGELDRAQYLESATALLQMIRADARLSPLADALNERRILLEDPPPLE
jgi:hypothetical protein